MPSRSLADQADSLAAYLPSGRAWAAKKIEGTVTRALLKGLSGELLRSAELVEEFRREIIPDETTAFVAEWERALKIPDGCFTGLGTLDERRADVLAKLASLGIQSAEDMRILAQQIYGINLTIRNPARDPNNTFPYTFQPTGELDPAGDGGAFTFDLSDREARFQIVIEYQNLPKAILFPYTFPIPFLTREVAIIECLFARLRPANVGFSRDIPVPAESPSPPPQPPQPFPEQTMSILFNGPSGSGEFTNDADGPVGVTGTWSISIWAKNDSSTSASSVDMLFAIRGTGNSDSIEIGSAFNGTQDLRFFVTDTSGVERQTGQFNGVIGGADSGASWHHYVLTWNGAVSGLKLFVDGVDQGAPDAHTANLDDTGIVDGSDRTVIIGGRTSGSGDQWQGPIFDVAMWSSQLSASQVTALYNSGDAPGALVTAVAPADFIHWWRLGLSDLAADFGLDRQGERDLDEATIDETYLTTDIPG